MLAEAKPRFLQIGDDFGWLNPHLRIRVEWDGMWERGDELMSKHVTFEIVPPTG